MTWQQTYAPLGNVFASAALGAVPVLVLLGALGLFHVSAHRAALLGLGSALAVAIFGFGMPAGMAAASAGYGAAFLYGLFAAGNSDINFLSINGADNGLHLVSAIAGVAIALWPARRTARSGLADRGA